MLSVYDPYNRNEYLSLSIGNSYSIASNGQTTAPFFNNAILSITCILPWSAVTADTVKCSGKRAISYCKLIIDGIWRSLAHDTRCIGQRSWSKSRLSVPSITSSFVVIPTRYPSSNSSWSRQKLQVGSGPILLDDWMAHHIWLFAYKQPAYRPNSRPAAERVCTHTLHHSLLLG